MVSLAKILLIDDDVDQHHLVRAALPAMAELECALDAQSALKLLLKKSYDLLLIDINLNEVNGLMFIEELKDSSLATDAIKIVLTGSEEEQDEIASHKLEVDDFIKKPIRKATFSALIERHLKKKVFSNIWEKGPLKINVSEMTVEHKLDGHKFEKIIITPKEFKILLKLIKNPGQVFSREQIFDGVWNNDDESYLRAIDTHVSSLRKKLGTSGVRVISIRGVGYKIELK